MEVAITRPLMILAISAFDVNIYMINVLWYIGHRYKYIYTHIDMHNNNGKLVNLFP